MTWVRPWNRIFRLINDQAEAAESYFSGPRFIGKVHEVDPDFPEYNQYIEQCRRDGKPTARKSFFYNILSDLTSAQRMSVMNSILREIEPQNAEAVAEIRGILGGGAAAPTAAVPAEAWNADRLNTLLQEMDNAIGGAQYERAVGLAYTCLEGFFKAFAATKGLGGDNPPNEIIALSRLIRDYLRETIADYPEEVLNLSASISHAVDRARNRFSEAHFAEDAQRWLACYTRDLANTQIRLLLHFM